VTLPPAAASPAPRRRSPPQRTGGRAPPRPLTASFGVDLRDGFNFVLTAVRGYAQHLLLEFFLFFNPF
jgi:hypothetical protein